MRDWIVQFTLHDVFFVVGLFVVIIVVMALVALVLYPAFKDLR